MEENKSMSFRPTKVLIQNFGISRIANTDHFIIKVFFIMIVNYARIDRMEKRKTRKIYTRSHPTHKHTLYKIESYARKHSYPYIGIKIIWPWNSHKFIFSVSNKQTIFSLITMHFKLNVFVFLLHRGKRKGDKNKNSRNLEV